MDNARDCIIGAGAAGMAALKTLLEEGFAVDCYEALHLITPRDSSAFEGFPMPVDYPLYPAATRCATRRA